MTTIQKKSDESTVGRIDIRHTDYVEYESLAEYNYLIPKAAIRHVLTFPYGKRFMASLSAIGSCANGDTVVNYDDAKKQLDTLVNTFIEKMKAVETEMRSPTK